MSIMGKVRGEPRNRQRDPENVFRIHTEISGIAFEYPGAISITSAVTRERERECFLFFER